MAEMHPSKFRLCPTTVLIFGKTMFNVTNK